MIFGHNCESCHDIRTYHRLTRLGFTIWKKKCFSCGRIMYGLSEESVTKRYNRMLESNVHRKDRKRSRRVEREMIRAKYAWKIKKDAEDAPYDRNRCPECGGLLEEVSSGCKCKCVNCGKVFLVYGRRFIERRVSE